MSSLTRTTATLERAESTFTKATQRLLESWRDGHANRFDNEILRPVRAETRHLINRCRNADQTVNEVAAVFRTLGHDL